MKIVLDTQKIEDANDFGEALRKYSFKEETGCYSCFDLLDSFVKVKKHSKTFKFFSNILLGSVYEYVYRNECDEKEAKKLLQEDMKRCVVYEHRTFPVQIAWFWDGDGTLIIKEKDKIAINRDCKKDYTWSWYKE